MIEKFWYLFFSLLIFSAPLVVRTAALPDLLSIKGGAYDLLRPKHRTFEFALEYKFHLKCLPSPLRFLELLPLIGIMTTAQRSGYFYGGVNFDFLFFDRLLVSPGFAAGYFCQGKGKSLGYPIEFRTGVECAWQFSDYKRIGIHFYHLSNASLGVKNPGEESLVFYCDIPINYGLFLR